MTDEQRAEIRKLQERALSIATAAAKEDIGSDAVDTVYVVVAARQLAEECCVLGSGVGHTTAVTLAPNSVRKILQTALATIGHEVPS